MLDVAIRGVRLADESGDLVEIGIEGGRIASIGPEAGRARDEVVGAGAIALPALVDVHVHFNEPGRTAWEGLATGSAALAAGGGATCCDMPLNSEPPVLDADAFARKGAAVEASSVVDVGIWAGLTPGNLGDLERLAAAGAIGFKAFMSDSGISSFAAVDDHALWQGMRIAAGLDLPVAVHAENDAITRRLAQRARAEGRAGPRDWAASRPTVAEVEAIGRAVALAEDAGATLHVVHVSTPEGVDAIARARRRGVDVTCETCPHYLHFADDDLERVGIALKCAPPIRDERQRAALWSRLRAGHVHLIASDHSPAPPDMKEGLDWLAAWGGVAGVQSTLAVLLAHLDGGDLGWPDLTRLTAAAPAERFALPRKGRLEIGYDADVALVERVADPAPLARGDLKQRHAISPYVGERFPFRVARTLRRGETIYSGGTIAAPGGGRVIRPNARS